MTANRTITISGRVYRRNPEVDRYQIHLDELEGLLMREIPPHSHLEILGLPEPKGVVSMEVFGLNGGDEGNHEHLEVYGGASFKVSADQRSRIVSRLTRAFIGYGDPDDQGYLPNPSVSTQRVKDGILANVFLNLRFKDKPDTPVREAVIPFIEGFRRLDAPSVRVFICHGSEDKLAARDLATAMKQLGADVWFDDWEIKVGDSIVQRIGEALGSVSHLVVLLSRTSVNKPWVQKELSAALMQQLSKASVVVLPVRLDNCEIPPILADIPGGHPKSPSRGHPKFLHLEAV